MIKRSTRIIQVDNRFVDPIGIWSDDIGIGINGTSFAQMDITCNNNDTSIKSKDTIIQSQQN